MVAKRSEIGSLDLFAIELTNGAVGFDHWGTPLYIGDRVTWKNRKRRFSTGKIIYHKIRQRYDRSHVHSIAIRREPDSTYRWDQVIVVYSSGRLIKCPDTSAPKHTVTSVR